MNIYETIYDEVHNNLENAGSVMEYHKATLLADVGQNSQSIDLSRMLELQKMEFVEAIYVAVLKRLPEESETNYWKNRQMLSNEQFQSEVIRMVFHSGSASVNHMNFIHNPYFDEKKGIRYYLFGMLYGLTDKSFLREFGKKMPQPVQKIIRKLFL